MGMIDGAMGLVFGSGRNVIAETAEVFRVNAEAEAGRGADMQGRALAQFGQEFLARRRSWFDRLVDGLNRVPRPAMALGTLALFVAAMIDPVWFAARMTGLALVPDPLWWLLGAIVSFYFGARHQSKGQEFQREIAATLAAAPQVAARIGEIERLRASPEATGAVESPKGSVPIPTEPAKPAAMGQEAPTASYRPAPAPAAQAIPADVSQREPNAALEDWARSRA